MKDTYGHSLSITLFGESHGPAIGATVEGIAPGTPIDTDFMAQQMDKRRASGAISTPRQEPDVVEFVSGVHQGKATGNAITLLIQNTNTKSHHYDNTKALLRPGHADYTAYAKYRGFQNVAGGGHFSGRLTAPIVAVGSLFASIFAQKGVHIATHLAQCAGIDDGKFSSNPQELQDQLCKLNQSHFALLDPSQEEAMKAKIVQTSQQGDSVGGILETAIQGLPAGLGEPFFTSVESVLASLLFSIPAVKGVEFGAGFAFATMTGSQANDPLTLQGDTIATTTNHNGGINGGITNGMPVTLRTVVKPTPSIHKAQSTIDYFSKTPETLQIKGRHDPCILHRARVVQDSMVAIGLADLCNTAFGLTWQKEELSWNTDSSVKP